MFISYLKRELVNRRKQTAIIASGMALAIALVIIVNSVSAGVQNAQSAVLSSVYGVGTDITISQTAAAPTGGVGGAGGQRFNFDENAGTSSNGTTTVNQARLEPARGTATFADSAVATVSGLSGVAAATGVLSLSNITFNGQLPDRSQAQGTGQGAQSGAEPEAQSNGTVGAGGSSFNVDSFTVLGIDPSGEAVGPLSAVTIEQGTSLSPADIGTNVAVVDSAYATAQSLTVGGTVTIAATTFTITGIVESSTGDATTAANVYIPLDVAQTLAGQEGKVSSVYVQAASASDISGLKTSIQNALPGNTVSTQADLASTVSGSLATASGLVSSLGTWLSFIVLAAAFLIAILFTISGVTRRTREFGTLKAIGWSNRRIVGQVAGESVVQGLIGGVAGIVIGLVGVLIVNLVSPTLTAVAAVTAGGIGGGPGAAQGAGQGRGPGGFGAAARAAETTQIALDAPVTITVVLLAVGLAVLGGLLAGAIGGWRASRLRPAEALRSVA
jgi:putative ABC transport system permease protein